jgi:hypothetical protein
MVLVYALIALLFAISGFNLVAVLFARKELKSAAASTDLIAVTKIAATTLEVVNKLPTPEQFNRVRSLAEAASLICEGMIPDSGIRAQSFDGAPVITGMKG